ncbi:beta-sandwich domain-containing protein [Caldisalinibacter kiritimatiensis]|uniref:Cellulosomal scaffoldin n=1 Tax=Caldisalinibacter kiritimatiensis TaxID=1304284 RepID=R1CZ49_9FIRM|nr:DUF2012 domain-containing protein [Caldisalinibacter kiritimatiensis]EOD01854.1 cellulosomal scaffoldin precursor [Caldisalinibacter kiritimatiensis]
MTKKRAILCFCIYMTIILLNPIIIYADNSTIELNSSSDTSNLKPGDAFTVNIDIKNVQNLVGSKIVVNYDHNLLQLENKNLTIENITDFTNIDGVTNENIVDNLGETLFLFGINKDITPISEDITIGTLTFKAIGKGSGSISINSDSKIVYEDTDKNYGEIPYMTNDLSFNILGLGSISGNVSDKSSNGINNITVELLKNDVVAYSTTTSLNGTFSIADVVEGSYTLRINSTDYINYSQQVVINNGEATNVQIELAELVQGDMNNDGTVNIEDLVYIANYYGISSSDNSWNEAVAIADVNNDGKIDIIDLVFVTRRLNG